MRMLLSEVRTSTIPLFRRKALAMFWKVCNLFLLSVYLNAIGVPFSRVSLGMVVAPTNGTNVL